jgi:hypothetical protein
LAYRQYDDEAWHERKNGWSISVTNTVVRRVTREAANTLDHASSLADVITAILLVASAFQVNANG